MFSRSKFNILTATSVIVALIICGCVTPSGRLTVVKHPCFPFEVYKKPVLYLFESPTFRISEVLKFTNVFEDKFKIEMFNSKYRWYFYGVNNANKADLWIYITPVSKKGPNEWDMVGAAAVLPALLVAPAMQDAAKVEYTLNIRFYDPINWVTVGEIMVSSGKCTSDDDCSELIMQQIMAYINNTY